MVNTEIIKRFSTDNEGWESISNRVASVSKNNQKIKKYIFNGEFIPGGQILRGAGLNKKVLYNSYVTSINNNETEIDIANRITDWTKLGIGVGVNVSDWVKFREDKKKNYLNIIAYEICKSQQNIWEKGIKRTATMINIDFEIEGICELSLKISQLMHLRHINLGVLISDVAMKKALITGSIENVRLKKISNVIWKCGNPGIIFVDNVNKYHPVKCESLNACNSCAEQFLIPNEGCCLGSINLSKFTIGKNINFDKLKDCIKESIYFLDDVIDASDFPCFESKKIAFSRRRIGLGIMGLDTLFEKLNVNYDSVEANSISLELSNILKKVSINSSETLASTKGSFSDFNKSNFTRNRRNLYLNSIAPTGAISMLFENSSGIEPMFASSIIKDGIKVNLRNDKKKNTTIYDIPISNQIEMLSIWQKNIDGGISKTLNVPEACTENDIFKAIINAWKMECKGLSIYRQNSRQSAFTTM